MVNSHPKIIQVTPEESALLLEARRIDSEALTLKEQREKESYAKYGKSVIDPFVDYRTEEAAQIMQAFNALKAEYAANYNLDVLPILIPAPHANTTSTPAHNPDHIPHNVKQSYNSFYQNNDMHLLPEDLKTAFLTRVPMFRDRERLYVWDTNHYRFFTDNEVKARIKTVLKNEFYVPNPTALLNNILTLIKVEESIIGTPDAYPNLIAVKNGELNLNTMILSPSSPSHHLTHYLDVPWLGSQPCPVFDKFVAHAAGGDPELITRIWETIGFLLVSDNRAKRFVVFQGEGDCGKSLLCNLLISYFERGDYSTLADYQFGERFSLSFIANSHFCSCMDLSDGTIDGKAVSTLKQITGGDHVSIEPKGKDAFTDKIHCKVLFGTNNPIKLKSRDYSFARRLLLIPFRYPVADKNKDRDLINKFLLERSGILYHAMCAYRNVVINDFSFTGESRFGFTADHIVVDASGPNSIEFFVNEHCIADQHVFTTTEALHNAFLDFCSKHTIAGIGDRAAFSRALNGYLKGLIRADKRRIAGVPTNGYWGIRLKEDGGAID